MQEVNVRVAVRVRPLLPQEKLHHHELCLKVLPKKNQIIVGKDRAFTFDNVLSSRTSQEDAYQRCVKGLVSSFFEGYNATIFAYGQTGSGKTYTIGGHDSVNLTEDEIGIIPRAVQQMFDIMRAKHNVDCILRVSYIEVYKEELRDLLDMETSSKDMHIREDEQGNTVILGSKEIICTSIDEVLSCLETGAAHRHTGATNMNVHSSRSHSIFTINVEQRWEDAGTDDAPTNSVREVDEVVGEDGEEIEHTTNFMSAKFHFVDLAGSERANRTGNAGERFKESVHINSGLLSLGNVISALSDPKRKIAHIPYRDSKITRILKDSLGGNAKTCMLTCISPSAVNFDETLNALKYANRARNIKNKPIINRDVQSVKIAAMQTEIQALREELQRHRLGTANPDTRPEGQEKVRNLENQIISLRTECSHYKVCTEEAGKIFNGLLDSESLTKRQKSAIRNWMDMVKEVEDDTTLQEGVASREGQRKVIELEAQLKKAMNDLASDEDIFAAKNRENAELKAQIQDLESSNDKEGQAFGEASERIHQQEAQLVEQQTQIQELQNMLQEMQQIKPDLDESDESLHIEIPVTAGRRAVSVPARMVGRKRLASAGDPLLSARPQSRKLHTSPPLFSLERIVQGFRARSQLLLKRLEEEDEVMQESLSGSSDEEEEEDEEEMEVQEGVQKNRSLGKTWSIHGSQGSNKSVRTQSRGSKDKVNKRLPPKRQNTIIKRTKVGDSENLPRPGPHIEKLRSGAEKKKKEVRESQTRLNKVQQRTRDLALNIRLKEELIRELVKTGKESEAMNKKYSDKIKKLEKESEQARSELRDAQQSLHNLSAQDKPKQEEDYKRKMVAARSKVKSLERKQQEMGKTLKTQGQSDKKICELETAIGRMKQHQELMQQRLKDEGERKAKLEREMQRDQQHIKELEIRNEHQQKILKRKTEEIAVAKRRLRRGSAGSTAPDGSDEQAKIDEQRRWLDSEVEKVLLRKQKMKDLEGDLTKREAIIDKKEALLRQKGNIEIKRMRSSQVLSKDITGLSSRIETVEKQIEAKTSILRASVESQRGPIKDEIKALKKERDHLYKQRSVLDSKLQQGTILSPREERRLIELDEGIDALDAAMEFKSDTIAQKQKDLRSTDLTQSEIMLAGRFNSLSVSDARTLLTRYFEKVIDLREAEKHKDLEISELQMNVDEQSRFTQEVEGALEKARMELDRRLTEQEKKHEQRVQHLIRQMKDGASLESITGAADSDLRSYENRIQELEKDLYYYKKTSRELKKKLREFVSSSTASTYNGKERHEVHSSTSSITSHSGDSRHEGGRTATPVRKSRKDVRELSAAEVSLRRSGASQSGSLKSESVERNGSNPWT